MTFFNKKEEILEIKLTSYGKHLLGHGSFAPVYYKFFDDDILYDSEFANFSESSGVAEARIQENTPSLRLRTSFRDLEKEVRKLRPATMVHPATLDYELMLYNDELFLETHNAFSAALPLGNSDHGSNKVPAWKVVELKNGLGNISAFSNILQNPISAKATITINNNTNINEGDKIIITDFAGREIEYTATELTPLNLGTIGEYNFFIKAFGVTFSKEDIAASLADSINASPVLFYPGPDSFTATVDGETVTVYQKSGGSLGNGKTIVLQDNSGPNDLGSSISVTAFAGGIDAGLEDTVSSPVVNIPNIQSDITASMTIKQANFCGPIDPETQKYVHVYSDNTYIDIDDDFLLLKVSESYVPLTNEGFEIEVFEVRIEDGEEILIPKMFKKKVEYVRNGILLDEEEINEQMRNSSLEVNSNYVEYWFDIRVDGQIDNKTRCEYIIPLSTKGNIFDNTIGCESYSQDAGNSLYPPDDFEPEECE